MENTKQLHYGEWFINGEETSINGVIEINPLENSYSLTLYSDTALSIPYYPDMVSGKTYDGKAFTLYKCRTGGSRSTSMVHDYKDKFTYTITSNYLLEGVAFDKVEDILIKDAYFRVTNLDKWAFQNAVDVKFEEEDAEHIITTKMLEDIAHRNEEFDLKITYMTSPDYKYKFTSSLTITTYVRVELNFKKPTDIVHAHSLMNQFRDFCSLCTTVPTFIEEISAVPHYPNDQEIKFPIKIHGQAVDTNLNRNKEDLKLPFDYISLEKIKDTFDTCMGNWFAKNEKLKPVIDCYSSVKYHRTSYERHFLNLVQALEAFHRLTRKNNILPRAEHRARVKTILEAVPPEYQELVKGRLSYANEPTLHDRLEELLTPNDDYSHPEAGRYHHLFTSDYESKEALIIDIKNTRNYNTHFDERLREKTVKGEKLVQLTMLLAAMIEYYLLTELEMDEKTILDITWDKVSQISTRKELFTHMKDGKVSM